MDIALITQVPSPRHFASDRVIAADNARGRILILAVANLRAGHHYTIDDRGRRRDGVPAWDFLTQTLPEVHRAVLTEVLARLAGVQVNGDQSRVQRGLHYTAAALSGLWQLGSCINRHPAAGCRMGDGLVGYARIMSPVLFTGGGVDRDHDVLGRAHQQIVSDLDRCGFRRVPTTRIR
ncbi:hypothetical protein D3C76_835740 [compost metagenome]